MKKLLLSIVAVFVAWQVLDFLLHGVLLMGMYEETQNLWRPMEEMKNGVMMVVGLISAAVFCYIYYSFITVKSLNKAIMYGVVYGIGAGITFGYGSYSFMPIPYSMAFAWFLGTIVETAAAGVIVGLILKEEN